MLTGFNAAMPRHVNRFAGCKMSTLGLGQLGSQRCLEAGVARQSEHVTEVVGLAPRHQLVVGKSTQLPAHQAEAAIHLNSSASSVITLDLFSAR
jgi:hypothetical protein